MRERFGGSSWAVLLWVAAATGCACPGTYYYGGTGCGMRALSGRNGDGSATCGGDCSGDCTACDTCVPSGPSRLRDVVGCNSGCGRMYWGEWAYDPPDACDPCDNGGNWIGPQECPPRGIWCLLDFLHGSRSCGGCGSASCEACEPAAADGCDCDGGSIMGSPDEEIWSDNSELILEPSPTTQELRQIPPQGGSVLRESRRIPPSKQVLKKQTSSRVVRHGRTPDMH